MSYETTKGLDFFSSILESPIYANTSSSEVVISSSDMEALDSLGTGSNIFLIMGDTITTREVVKALFTKTTVGTVVTRTLWTVEATLADHDIGEQIYCGLSYRYLEEIKEILDEIDTETSALGSTVIDLSESLTTLSDEVVDAQEDINTINEQVSNIQKISIHADFSDGNFDSLEVGEEEIYVPTVDITAIPLKYTVPANCGQLTFSLPENNDIENRKIILLDFSECSVGGTIIFQEPKYVPLSGSSQHILVVPFINYDPVAVTYTPIDIVYFESDYPYVTGVVINDLDIGFVTIMPIALISGHHLIP